MSTATVMAYQRQVDTIRTRTAAAVTRAFNGGLSEADIGVWLKSVDPVMTGSSKALTRITEQYLRLEVAQQLARTGYVGPILDYTDITSGVRGVPWAEEYLRPVGELRYKAALETHGYDVAKAQFVGRVTNMVNTDLQYVKTRTSHGWLNEAGVKAYRRVVGGVKPCSLCLTAAINVYHSATLMPIHNNCHCSVQPMTSADIGQVQTGESGRYAQDVKVVQHSELGPQLVGDREIAA